MKAGVLISLLWSLLWAHQGLLEGWLLQPWSRASFLDMSAPASAVPVYMCFSPLQPARESRMLAGLRKPPGLGLLVPVVCLSEEEWAVVAEGTVI